MDERPDPPMFEIGYRIRISEESVTRPDYDEAAFLRRLAWCQRLAVKDALRHIRALRGEPDDG